MFWLLRYESLWCKDVMLTVMYNKPLNCIGKCITKLLMTPYVYYCVGYITVDSLSETLSLSFSLSLHLSLLWTLTSTLNVMNILHEWEYKIRWLTLKIKLTSWLARMLLLQKIRILFSICSSWMDECFYSNFLLIKKNLQLTTDTRSKTQ